MVGSGPGELGDRITVADLELPGDLGTSQNQFAVHMTAIGDLVIDDGERPRSADRGRGRKGVGADDVDGDDAATGGRGQSDRGGDCPDGPFGRRLHARVRARANDLLFDMLDTFDAEDRERLASLMERLVAAVDERRGTPGNPASTPSG